MEKDQELVAMPKAEYERLKKLDWELQDAKGKIARGMKAWREGKTIVANSIDDAVRRVGELGASD